MVRVRDLCQFFFGNTVMPTRGIAIVQSIAAHVDRCTMHADQFLDPGVDPVAQPDLFVIRVEAFQQFWTMSADALRIGQ